MKKMQKLALDLGMELPELARGAVGGALIGAGGMSVIELARMLAAARRDAKAMKEPTETDKNTIVLRLPAKTAATVEDMKTKLQTFATKIQRPIKRNMSCTAAGQCRRPDGTMGKLAATGWPTLTGKVLATLGGIAGGAAIVDKIYDMQRERKLRAQLEAAQTEYVNILSGGEAKSASEQALLNIFSIDGTKTAAPSNFGLLNYPLAYLALLTTLGAGSTAYLTKRVLDEKLRDAENVGMDIPKVNRIILRTADGQDVPADQKQAQAAIVLAIQSHKGELGTMADADFKMACAVHGLTPDSLLKRAAYDVGGLVNDMSNKYPDLVSLLQTKYMQANGGPLGWLANKFPNATQGALTLPGFRHLANRSTSKAISSILPIKSAAPSLPVGSALAGAIGADALLDDPADAAKAVVDAQAKAEAEKRKVVVPDSLRVQGDDAGALQYIAEHRDQIEQLLSMLAVNGKV